MKKPEKTVTRGSTLSWVMSFWYVSALESERVAEHIQLFRKQGAGSNPVVPTSIYKERPHQERSFLLYFVPIHYE